MASVKQQVRERDEHRCVDCGMTAEEQSGYFGRTLHVHRTDPGSSYTVGGCVSLCTCCHVARHGGAVSRRLTRYVHHDRHR